MQNVRITQLDETTTLAGNEVVVDSPAATQLYKVDLGTVVNVVKNAAETTDATVASAAGLTAEVVPPGEPPEYNYVPDNGTNYIKVSDFAAAGLTANLKNADILLDAAIAAVNTIGGAKKDVHAIGGSIDGMGNYNVYNIISQDTFNIHTINFDANINKLVVIANNSGAPIRFEPGGNLLIRSEIDLAQGDYTLAVVTNNVVHFITAAFMRDLIIEQQNIGIGNSCLHDNIGTNILAAGVSAGFNNSGTNCIFLGEGAGKDNIDNNRFEIKHEMASPDPFIAGDLQTGVREYRYGQGTTVHCLDFQKTLADDEEMTMPIDAVLANIDVTVLLPSGVVHAARYSCTSTTTQLLWGDGKVFAAADVDDKFCVYNNFQPNIRNRLGASVSMIVSVQFIKVIN